MSLAWLATLKRTLNKIVEFITTSIWFGFRVPWLANVIQGPFFQIRLIVSSPPEVLLKHHLIWIFLGNPWILRVSMTISCKGRAICCDNGILNAFNLLSGIIGTLKQNNKKVLRNFNELQMFSVHSLELYCQSFTVSWSLGVQLSSSIADCHVASCYSPWISLLFQKHLRGTATKPRCIHFLLQWKTYHF